MSDKFSTGSDRYARFRPGYPDEMVELIVSSCANREVVWDAGSGTGQLSSKLAPYLRSMPELFVANIRRKHFLEIGCQLTR